MPMPYQSPKFSILIFPLNKCLQIFLRKFGLVIEWNCKFQYFHCFKTVPFDVSSLDRDICGCWKKSNESSYIKEPIT